MFVDYSAHLKEYSGLSHVPTGAFFYGLLESEEIQVEIAQGKALFIKLVAISEADEEGRRTLFFELNGHPREVTVQDESLAVEEVRRIKADPDNLHHLGSPMAGMVAAVHVKAGEEVAEGDTLIVLEAMKMEMILASPLHGVVKEVYVKNGDRVDGGDLMVVFQ